MAVDTISLLHCFPRFVLLILASFSEKKSCFMHASNVLQNIRFPAGWIFFIFETTTNHFVAQSSLENGACNDASRFAFPCCPLETFYPRGQVKLGYGLQTFITKSPSFSAIGIRTIPTVVCNVCFLFLLSFFGKLRDWLNKQVTVISSQSARRRRLVDQ